MTMSLVQTNYCKQQKYDPEDPRCAKVILSGNVVKVNSTFSVLASLKERKILQGHLIFNFKVTDESEVQFAQQAVFSRHPEMQEWPKGFCIA